jgi:hypothetical protein
LGDKGPPAPRSPPDDVEVGEVSEDLHDPRPPCVAELSRPAEDGRESVRKLIIPRPLAAEHGDLSSLRSKVAAFFGPDGQPADGEDDRERLKADDEDTVRAEVEDAARAGLFMPTLANSSLFLPLSPSPRMSLMQNDVSLVVELPAPAALDVLGGGRRARAMRRSGSE